MPIQNKKLAAELRRLGRKDQLSRRTLKPRAILDDVPDRENTKRLKIIVKRYGWPTIGRVGKVGSRAAWLIAQHAAFDRAFQKLALREMTRAHRQNKKDIEPYQLAYLADRILVESGRPQLFGTQFKISKNGTIRPNPIKDRAHLDARRATYGLGPFVDYLRQASRGMKKKT